MPQKQRHQQWLLSASLFFISCQVAAQQVPDAGSLLRDQPKPPAAAPSLPSRIEPAQPAEDRDEAGPRVIVKAFVFQGALLIAKEDLGSLLQPYIGKELSFRQLQSLAFRIVAFYVERGYMARVVLPPQEIADGVVTYQIIEGKRGSLNITPQGEHIDSARVRGLIDYRLAGGDTMRLDKLGEALNLLNEQPGIEARASLTSGKGEGEIDLNVNVAEKPLLTGSLQANNHGSEGTGIYQLQGLVGLNNPTGHFDAATLLVNANRGSTYLRADYSAMINDAGLRLGINASQMDYEVIKASMKALDPHGSATTYGLTASYPLSRLDQFDLSLTGAYDQKRLIDKTSAGETSDREVNVVTVGLSGLVQPTPDNLFAGGNLTFGASMSLGDSQQNNAGARAADRTTRRVEGNYSKFAYNFGYIRPLAADWNLNASLRGQFADKNLDSSEGFALGGPSGIRAYPAGEGAGDEGWLLNLNFRRNISDSLAATLFFDAGGVKLNRDTWANWNAGNPSLDNRYQLYGIGVGVDWRFVSDALLSATLATPLGNNPGRDTNNHNVDGKDNQTRLWLTVNAQF